MEWYLHHAQSQSSHPGLYIHAGKLSEQEEELIMLYIHSISSIKPNECLICPCPLNWHGLNLYTLKGSLKSILLQAQPYPDKVLSDDVSAA